MEAATQGFALLEDRLRETRRRIGLTADGSAPTPPQGVVPAPAAPPARPTTAAASGRMPVGDLVLLGVGWSGLALLVALAL